jgi:hypothetical protein
VQGPQGIVIGKHQQDVVAADPRAPLGTMNVA